jgi:hypothetical protein
MKTTMNIPKDLLKEAIILSGAASQTMAVILGLQELIKKKRLEKLASMQGSGALRLSETEMKILRSR